MRGMCPGGAKIRETFRIVAILFSNKCLLLTGVSNSTLFLPTQYESITTLAFRSIGYEQEREPEKTCANSEHANERQQPATAS